MFGIGKEAVFVSARFVDRGSSVLLFHLGSLLIGLCHWRLYLLCSVISAVEVLHRHFIDNQAPLLAGLGLFNHQIDIHNHAGSKLFQGCFSLCCLLEDRL